MTHIPRRAGLRRICILIALANLAMILSTVPFASPRFAAVPPAYAADKPNVMLILLDDLDYKTLDNLIRAERLPHIKANLYDQGMNFTRAYVTNSLCCPSRATIYTGQYPHNHGLWSNQGDNVTERYQSGWPYYRDHLQDQAVNVALRQHDYFTGMVGKFMNGTDETTIAQRPEGWDLFYYLSGGLGYGMYGYPYRKWDTWGAAGTLATAPEIYQPDKLAQEALTAIQRNQPSGKPFFLVYAPTVPHVEPSMNAKEDLNWPSTTPPDNRIDFNTYEDTWRLHIRGRLNTYALPLPEATDLVTFTATSPSCYTSADGPCAPPADCSQPPYPCSQPSRMLRTPWQQGQGRWQVQNPDTGQYDPLLDVPYADTIDGGERLVGENLQDPATYKPFWLRQGFGNFHIGTTFPDAGPRPALGYRDSSGAPVGDIDSRDALIRQQLGREEAMIALDDALGAMFAWMRGHDAFDNTLIMLTSDNGMQLGEHNLGQKEAAYEESIHVPLIVRDPAHLNPDTTLPIAPWTSDAIVLNNDIAPTIAQYTTGSSTWAEGRPDGRSLLPFISLEYGAPFRRVRFLIEHKAVTQDYWTSGANTLQGGIAPPTDWIENFDTATRADDIKHMPFYEIPHYTALRTIIPNGEDSLYVEYSYEREEYPPYAELPTTQVDLGTFPISLTTEIEFLNLRTDPYQMRPAETPPNTTFAARMPKLLGCSGAAACARIEDTHTVSDYDGDEKTDLVVWRPSDGIWHISKSSSAGGALEAQWGKSGDIPMSGDYDGDGISDLAVWRPSDGTWHISKSAHGGAALEPQWGQPGDTPVSGDFDGDRIADLAVWRPADGTWHVSISATAGITLEATLGAYGDIPAPGDYDGDGITDFAVWRPADGTWHILKSSTGAGWEPVWGGPGDVSVPGDYDGDGITDVAIWRPADATWHISMSAAGGAAWAVQLGAPQDIPVTGDYDGDGTTDFAVWRPADGTWHISKSLTGSVEQLPWGRTGDVVLPRLVVRHIRYLPLIAR